MIKVALLNLRKLLIKSEDGPSRFEILNHTQQAIPHPGAWFESHLLAPRGIDRIEAAKQLSVTAETLTGFLEGRYGLTAPLALRIEEQFGVPAAELLELQAVFNLAQSRERTRAG